MEAVLNIKRGIHNVGEAAEAGFASMYLTGVAVKVLCQFVPEIGRAHV